jgi:hypothetical protein
MITILKVFHGISDTFNYLLSDASENLGASCLYSVLTYQNLFLYEFEFGILFLSCANHVLNTKLDHSMAISGCESWQIPKSLWLEWAPNFAHVLVAGDLAEPMF